MKDRKLMSGSSQGQKTRELRQQVIKHLDWTLIVKDQDGSPEQKNSGRDLRKAESTESSILPKPKPQMARDKTQTQKGNRRKVTKEKDGHRRQRDAAQIPILP